MELWRELLIGGLQNENYEIAGICDKVLKEIIENRSYKVLLRLKETIEDASLTDESCFMKLEKILSTLEDNCIFCDRHDFG